MTRRRSRHDPLAWFLALLALAAALNAVAVIERLAGPLLMAAAAGLAVRAITRRDRRSAPPGGPPKMIRGQAEDDAELVRLRAEVEALRAERDQARESERAAWERASEPDAQGATVVDLRARLLRDARSGARPL
jgi:hypothetical protein